MTVKEIIEAYNDAVGRQQAEYYRQVSSPEWPLSPAGRDKFTTANIDEICRLLNDCKAQLRAALGDETYDALDEFFQELYWS
jgi:hypothetical protein